MEGNPRYWCVMYPCCPCEFTGDKHLPEITGAASFATRDAYLRHVEQHHYIARKAAPEPVLAFLGGPRVIDRDAVA